MTGSCSFVSFFKFYLNFFAQYQRWLYPVDKNRVDDGTGEYTESDATESIDKSDTKKNK